MRLEKRLEQERTRRVIFALRNAMGECLIGQAKTALLEMFFIVLSSVELTVKQNFGYG